MQVWQLGVYIMMGPYLEHSDWEEIRSRLDSVIRDTFHCWEATRLRGISASMSCEGNQYIPMLKEMDKLVVKIESKADEKICENCKYSYEHHEIMALCCERDISSGESCGVGVVSEDFGCNMFEVK